jgi:tripartite-type tricarboxylate transporter receptor subunit TctC
MPGSFRSLHYFGAALCASLCLSASAWGQTYPTRPVSLMVPYPVGGLSDVIARAVNTAIGKRLNQPVIVENLGGVSGALAASKVLAAPSDGYYIFQGSPNELILSPLANSAVKFKSEDFRLVQMIAVAPMAVFARKDLPANNGDELVAYAAQGAKNGKPLSYASVGIGSFYHLLGEHMSKLTNVPMTHVPYKGGAPAQQDLIGGQVDIYITPFGKPQLELVNQGRIKVVAGLSANRVASIKQVPTLNESKALKGFVFDIWTGFFVKRDTPEPIVLALHKALTETLSDPQVVALLESLGMEISKPLSLDSAAKAYADGTAEFRAIAKAINLQPQ